MKLRVHTFVLLCLFAVPATNAFADTVIFDSYDPGTGTRQFTVTNEFAPVFDEETGELTFREVIAFAVGLDDRFTSLETSRDPDGLEPFIWHSAVVTKDEWDGSEDLELDPFSWESGTLNTLDYFGSFDSVFNQDEGGIQFSRGAMFFDNEGPENNFYIAPGETDGRFFAFGPPDSPPIIIADYASGSDDSYSFYDWPPPYVPGATPAGLLTQTSIFDADTDDDGQIDDPSDWVLLSSSIDPPILQDTVIPLPSAAWMGLGLLALLAFRRRLRLKRT